MNVPDFVTQSEPTSRPEHLYRPHPGEVLARRCLNDTKFSRGDAASIIGISAKHLSRFINGHVRVEVELARKLEACTPISAGSWLHYQNQHDLYKNARLDKSPVQLAG